MRVLGISIGPGRPIEQFSSTGAQHLGGARFNGGGGLTFLSLAAGSRIGRHPTLLAQLYCVTSGSGWVAGADGNRIAVRAGQAALWEPGEEHESGSDEGMEVAIVEAASVEV